MSEKNSDEIFDTLPKKPNFLLVVILSGIAILIIFLGAYLLLSDTGKKLLPRLSPNSHPTSQVIGAPNWTADA